MRIGTLSYQLSNYGPNPHAGVPRNNASQRGWGAGWPNCQRGKQLAVRKAGVTVLVRAEIAPLIAALFEATENLGYDIMSEGQGACGGTWGYACRPIRGTQYPSNHSWGLAVDINAPCNPMGSRFISDIPPEVVRIWEACGFYWGGRYQNRPDAMHFEYIRRPEDVPAGLLRALNYLTNEEDDVLKQGDRGHKVRIMQWQIKAYLDAYHPGLLEEKFRFDRFDDGHFGPVTEGALKLVQQLQRLPEDGVYDLSTALRVADMVTRDREAKAIAKALNEARVEVDYSKLVTEMVKQLAGK